MSGAAEARQPADVPTFTECVIGYRVWRADEHGQLWPLSSARRPWLPGTNTARCNCRSPGSLRFEWSWYEGRRVLEPAPEHAAPQGNCSCGLYSWRRPVKAWYEAPTGSRPLKVVGAVASWGHLQVHAGGFRAEHACIVTLAYHHQTPTGVLPTLQPIAARYRVELVPLAALEQAASHYGTPLPDGLRPQGRDQPGQGSPSDDENEAASTATPLGREMPPHEPLIHQSPASPAVSRSTVPSRVKAAARYALLAALGVVTLAIGLVSLWHPIAGWAFGESRRAEAPPVWGAGLLVFPVAIIGFGVQRAWWSLSLDLEAWRRRRRRRHRR